MGDVVYTARAIRCGNYEDVERTGARKQIVRAALASPDE